MLDRLADELNISTVADELDIHARVLASPCARSSCITYLIHTHTESLKSTTQQQKPDLSGSDLLQQRVMGSRSFMRSR